MHFAKGRTGVDKRDIANKQEYSAGACWWAADGDVDEGIL
jgi:hypothetical protein